MIRILAIRKDMSIQSVSERLLRFALDQPTTKVFPPTLQEEINTQLRTTNDQKTAS